MFVGEALISSQPASEAHLADLKFGSLCRKRDRQLEEFPPALSPINRFRVPSNSTHFLRVECLQAGIVPGDARAQSILKGGESGIQNTASCRKATYPALLTLFRQ